jgi:hypothetical protein
VADDAHLFNDVWPVAIRTVSAAYVADRLQVKPPEAFEALDTVIAVAAVSDAVNAGGVCIEVLVAETLVKSQAGSAGDVEVVQRYVTAQTSILSSIGARQAGRVTLIAIPP